MLTSFRGGAGLMTSEQRVAVMCIASWRLPPALPRERTPSLRGAAQDAAVAHVARDLVLRALSRAQAARARTCSAANRLHTGHAAKPVRTRFVAAAREPPRALARPPDAAWFIVIIEVIAVSGTLRPGCARRVATHRAQLHAPQRRRWERSSSMEKTALQVTRRRAAAVRASHASRRRRATERGRERQETTGARHSGPCSPTKPR